MNSTYKTIKVEDSAGTVLMHDITQIIPGKSKGPVFKKGHIISKSDIGLLKDIGKENIYVFEIGEHSYHEDTAAEIFKKLAGKNISTKGPSEGKLTFIAEKSGLLIIEKEKVDSINSIGEIALTTVHSGIAVNTESDFAGIRVIPLVIDKAKVEKACRIAGSSVFEILPFKKKKIGLIVTGNEIASGRTKDAFRPVIEKKAADFDSKIYQFKIMGDDPELMIKEINRMIESGCDFIVLTGGMSVDPDDVTKSAIKNAGVEVVSYGAPVLPGNMFMVAYKGSIPIFGVPACAMYHGITVLDLFLPYVFSGKKIERDEIIKRGYGGYCLHCEECRYPVCGFGKC